MRKLYLFIITLFLIVSYCKAQVDTEFWFVPPEVSAGHGDRPVYLRISTLDKPTTIKVTQPARGNLELANVSVAANTTHTINLSNYISTLETNIPASVMKTGLRIVSTAPITAYYEIGSTWNADIFALKGRNALGNKFVIPAQNYYNNSAGYFPTPYSSFDVVATKNNTVIKVRPTKPIFGHSGDSVITVKLNAGETYSFRKVSLLASDNPAGTVVESNKPIAVTLKDDSVINENGGCRDLLGDQLVPVKVAGVEYVVLKGFLDTDEYLFITATENETEIYIGGGNDPVAVLDAGEIYRHRITQQATYVLSSKTIYVFHVTGFGCELGMAILPSINCKGSQQIGFSRTTNEFFGLNILVRKEGVNSFKLNNSSALAPASEFAPVPGTNEKWYAAQLSFTTSQIQVGQASLISNDQYSFQIGIINGNASTTCRYGYFSAFSTLFIGDDFNICEGETATIDAGPGKESYLWNTGASTQSIEVSSPGEYWVRVENEECLLYDTLQIDVKKGEIELGSDVSVCKNDTATVDGKDNFSWQWSTGDTNRFLKTTEPGKYWVSVFDNNGCQASDTINVVRKESPKVDLGVNVLKCPNVEWELDASFPGATYMWDDGSTAPVRMITDSGEYHCAVFLNGCTASDTILVSHMPGPPQDTLWGSPSVCPFAENIAYEVEDNGNSSYQWFVKGGEIVFEKENYIRVDWKEADPNARVSALVTNLQGCTGDTLLFPVRINAELLVETPRGSDTLCFNKSDQVVYNTPLTNGSVYEWKIMGGTLVDGQGSHEVTVNWTTGTNQLWIEETSTTIDTVCRGISPALSVYVFEDPAGVEMNYASVDTAVQENILLSWTIVHPDRISNDSLYLYKRQRNDADWQLFKKVPASLNSLTDPGNFTHETSYEYYLSLENLCQEELHSNIHTTILLTGEADTIKDELTFRWNPYQGWENGVGSYELWRKLEDADGYGLLTILPGDKNSYTAKLASDGFLHEYVIRAREKGGKRESWSNSVDFKFDHPLYIPNVFTPNGDTFNQFFHIAKIELYKNSELLVMDRWGRNVFKAKGYKNDWDGEGLTSGVYYYVLDLKRNNKILKGTVSIIR